MCKALAERGDPTSMQDDEAFGKMFLCSMEHNLNWNLQFHNELRRLMHNEVVSINLELDGCEEKERKGDLNFRKRSLVDSFYDYSLSNTFLMQWSLIEEILYLVHKFNYPNIEIPKKTTFQKYRPVFLWR